MSPEVLEAESSLRLAVDIDPSLANAHYNLGKVLIHKLRATEESERKENFEAAIAQFTQAADLEPRNGAYFEGMVWGLNDGRDIVNDRAYISSVTARLCELYKREEVVQEFCRSITETQSSVASPRSTE